jgi:hypothetical protein
MEQSAQLFNAAAAIDYTSRPILLFYGLSQAGRAIAAASTAADNASYRLSGHGIECPDLSQRPPLHRLKLVDNGRGSFTQLASLLSSGSLPQVAPFGQVWAALPDLRDSPVNTEGIEYKPPLQCLEEYREDVDVLTGTIRLPWRVGKAPNAQEIETLLGAYPTLSDCETLEIYADPIGVGGDGFNAIHDHVVLDVMERVGFLWWAEIAFKTSAGSPTQSYIGADDLWLFPAMGGGSRPMHPLLIWWALLYALSMLARYEPASWINHLDVDASPNAVALETALDRALDACPQLVLHTIHSVTR